MKKMLKAVPKGGKTIDSEKVYVDVVTLTKADGSMEPKQLTWIDGVVYEIEHSSKPDPSVATNAGGQGDLYMAWTKDKSFKLFFEHNPIPYTPKPGKWFVERKLPRR